MSKHLFHRRRRLQPSNPGKREASTRFTHTRFTRRSLAQAVQRLIDASKRYALVPVGRSRWSHTLALKSWPDAVRVQISIQSLTWMGAHDGRGWDALFWPDCQPQRCCRGWVCALCLQYDSCSPVFRELSDL